jgi:C-terminal processing protease CtpA/Prc
MQTGIKNDSCFNGKIVLIVNEQTQSHAEFTAMCLQTAPNVVTLGSTTAGTDGNVSSVFLPGGIRCFFTGIGVTYPDGTSTQRIGIKIDTIVRPRIIDIKNKYDRLLEIAIEI